MTKKTFERIAQILRDDITSAARFGAAEQQRTRDAAVYAANVFATVAAESNPRFDRTRFMKACGF